MFDCTTPFQVFRPRECWWEGPSRLSVWTLQTNRKTKKEKLNSQWTQNFDTVSFFTLIEMTS